MSQLSIACWHDLGAVFKFLSSDETNGERMLLIRPPTVVLQKLLRPLISGLPEQTAHPHLSNGLFHTVPTIFSFKLA
jgi:hypothetical protein